MNDGSDADGDKPAPEGAGPDPLDLPTPPPPPSAEEGAFDLEATVPPDTPEREPGGFDPEATLPPPASPEALAALAEADEASDDTPLVDVERRDSVAGALDVGDVGAKDAEATLPPPASPEALAALAEADEASDDTPLVDVGPRDSVAGALDVGAKDAEVQDAEAKDAEVKDAEAKDAEAKDAEVQDAEAKDAEAKDAEVKDAEAKDAEAKDAEAKDAEAKDAEAKDAEVQDAEAKDAEAKDAEVQDAEAKDAEAKDAEAKDAEAKDAEVKDAEVKAAEAKAKDAEAKAAEAKDAEVQALLASLGGEDEPPPRPRKTSERIPLAPFLSRLEVATPIALEDQLEYSTLHDVQANLLSTLEDDQEDAFQRAFPRARKRVHALEEAGHDVAELEERLMLAGLMSGQGDHLAALQAVEEVLVIAKVLDEVGVIERYTPPPQLSEERVREMLGDELAPLRVRFERQLSQASEAWEERLSEHVEDRLDALLSEDRFSEAAATATASRPGELLERPELVARIDAVASRLDVSLLVSSNFFERVDKLVRERVSRFVEGGRLEALIDGLIRRRVEELASASVDTQVRGVLSELEEATARLDATIASQIQLALGDDAFLAEVDRRAREVVSGSEVLTAIEQHVLDSPARVPSLLSSDEFQIGIENRTTSLLSTGLFRETLEGSMRESQALAEAVLDGLGSSACGELLDNRIDERTQETFKQLERAVAEARAEAPTSHGVSRGPDPEELAATVQGLLQKAMVEKDFRRNVDNRVEELAHRGFLLRRIEEVVKNEIAQTPPVPDERLQKFVTKELANRQALQQAALTGDGLADQASLNVLIEEKVKQFLVDQVKKKKTKKKAAKKTAKKKTKKST